MFSRRVAGRTNRRGIPAQKRGGAAVINFATLFTPGTVLQSVQSDLGITQSAGKVSAWADQSGNNNHFSQATAAAQPALTAGLNGNPGVLFDGVDDYLTSTLNLPAPGTTPSFVWMVWRQIAWNASGIYFGTSTASHALIAYGAAQPTIAQYNGATASPNTGMIVNAFFRTESYYSNSVSDYLTVGSVLSSPPSSASNGQGNAFQLGNAGPIGGRFANMEFLASVVANALPSGPQLAALSAAVTAKYGPGVGV